MVATGVLPSQDREREDFSLVPSVQLPKKQRSEVTGGRRDVGFRNKMCSRRSCRKREAGEALKTLGRAERRCGEGAADSGSGDRAASRLARKKKVTDNRNGVIACEMCERGEFGHF